MKKRIGELEQAAEMMARTQATNKSAQADQTKGEGNETADDVVDADFKDKN